MDNADNARGSCGGNGCRGAGHGARGHAARIGLAPDDRRRVSGAVAWSGYDAAHKRYALMVLRDRHLTRAPVATRRAPFDISLGPTAGGKIAAVYSRCSTDPGRRMARDVLSYLRGYVANPQTGSGCRLREYVLGEKHERVPRIRGLGGISTAFPGTWRGRVVFAGSRRVHGHLRTAVYAARSRGVSTARAWPPALRRRRPSRRASPARDCAARASCSDGTG